MQCSFCEENQAIKQTPQKKKNWKTPSFLPIAKKQLFINCQQQKWKRLETQKHFGFCLLASKKKTLRSAKNGERKLVALKGSKKSEQNKNSFPSKIPFS
jgi:hypothetical protein